MSSSDPYRYADVLGVEPTDERAPNGEPLYKIRMYLRGHHVRKTHWLFGFIPIPWFTKECERLVYDEGLFYPRYVLYPSGYNAPLSTQTAMQRYRRISC